MLAAHMDAIGLMVTKVEGEFLRVTQVGGIDARVMPGQLVTVHGKEDLPGVVAQPAAFLLPKANREGVVPLSELVVDVGLPAEKVASLVRVGDVVSFAAPPRTLQNDMFVARSLDNRASVAALTVCLDALQTRPHVWDVIAVATVQEEVGVKGAITSAFALRPHLAVAIDVTHGAGPSVKEFSDAFGIQVAREGIPTMVVSLPLRNMHTPVEQLSVKDVTRAGRLLAEFIAGLKEDFVSTLAFE